MFDRGDNRLECLIEETTDLNVSIKHSWLLSPLSNIQACCLLYQTFMAAVSSIKHSWLLSPLSNIQACCLGFCRVLQAGIMKDEAIHVLWLSQGCLKSVFFRNGNFFVWYFIHLDKSLRLHQFKNVTNTRCSWWTQQPCISQTRCFSFIMGFFFCDVWIQSYNILKKNSLYIKI
jgi:hypothetical protein